MDDLARYLDNWQAEVDSAAQYRAMAAAEKDESVAKIYRALATIEEKHAGFWEKRIQAKGREPGPRLPSWRARVLIWCARRWGAKAILPTVASREYADRDAYARQKETARTRMTAEEWSHARVLQDILAKSSGDEGWARGRVEGRHRATSTNTLRAAVLGANDGLCTNLSLVMGVSGAAASEKTVLLTGVAGLLAGACSMALGEWVSVQSAKELAAREMAIEEAELTAAPEEEREELELIYRAKGLSDEEARDVSKKLVEEPKNALNVLAREELGINPADLGGSPWAAALSSMLLFALGAAIPVAPFFFASARVATFASLGAGAFGLFSIGAAISVFTGRSALFSGGRQLLLGLAAAGVTFGIGRMLGVAISG